MNSLRRAPAYAVIALGLAMALTAMRPMVPPAVEFFMRPGISADDARDLRDRAVLAAQWADRITLANGAILFVLGVAWLVRLSRRQVRTATVRERHPRELAARSDLPPKPADDRPAYRRALPIIAISLLAVIARLPGLGHSLWYDEIHTVQHYLPASYHTIEIG